MANAQIGSDEHQSEADARVRQKVDGFGASLLELGEDPDTVALELIGRGAALHLMNNSPAKTAKALRGFADYVERKGN